MNRTAGAKLLLTLLGIAVTILQIIPCSAQTLNPTESTTAYVLHSQARYREVHVPAKIEDGRILVQATLSGKPLLCEVDTGATLTAWANWLNLPCTFGDLAVLKDVYGTQAVAAVVILPDVQIGAYEVKRLPSARISTGEKESSPSKNSVHHLPLLGWSAFAGVTLTIDYAKSEIVLRSPEFEAAKQLRSPDSLVFDLLMVSANSRDVRQPTIRTSINGHVANVLLDTGWEGDTIGLSRRFWDSADSGRTLPSSGKGITSLKPVPVEGAFGPAKGVSVDKAAFTFGEPTHRTYTRPAFVVSNMRFDGAVGPDILQHYRVTFDFPHHKVVLEPYPVTASMLAVNSRQPTVSPPGKAPEGQFWQWRIIDGKTGYAWVEIVWPPKENAQATHYVGLTYCDDVTYAVWDDATVTPVAPARSAQSMQNPPKP